MAAYVHFSSSSPRATNYVMSCSLVRNKNAMDASDRKTQIDGTFFQYTGRVARLWMSAKKTWGPFPKCHSSSGGWGRRVSLEHIRKKMKNKIKFVLKLQSIRSPWEPTSTFISGFRTHIGHHTSTRTRPDKYHNPLQCLLSLGERIYLRRRLASHVVVAD